MENKKIFVFGGSGSLGNTLIAKYIDKNKIINFSRDEDKHWRMELKYKNPNLTNVVGNITNKERVKQSLLRRNPDIIIIAAAMKHIDRCEYASNESIDNNLLGIKNILDVVEEERTKLSNLESILFVSTDKACSPINIYGLCKALSEKLVIEKSHYIKDIKFVVIRYGNVLNSRGSIIPMLHEQGQNDEISEFTLTHEKMTRFIMTLEESCDLVEHALIHAESGDTVIPKLKSMYIKDLFEIFSVLYNKPIKLVGLRAGEKLDESLINKTQSARTVKQGKYYHIRSDYNHRIINEDLFEYDSGDDLLSKDELQNYLKQMNLI